MWVGTGNIMNDTILLLHNIFVVTEILWCGFVFAYADSNATVDSRETTWDEV